MNFAELGLDEAILKALAHAGYENPTPVQTEAIPAALEGHDLLVSSHTGSGKTAAFLLPGLQRMLQPSAVEGKGPRMLVLTPTRELALQVEKAARDYGYHLRKMRTACLVGGSPYGLQLKALSAPVDIVIATPGRLMDHMERGRIDFSRLETLVLDEADRMLDMGFIDDIEAIVKATPETRQTVLFSATLDGVVGNLARRLTKNPKRIEIATAAESRADIEQRLMFADNHHHKTQLLDVLLRDTGLNQALVFVGTKRGAEELSVSLLDQGFPAAALHGDMHQRERNRTLQHLRQGRTRILVATDVAARGIDVAGISHVINFEPPRQAEDYVHRIGRTGRAGRSGIAITFAGLDERRLVRDIERFTGGSLPVHTIAGLEPKAKPAPRNGTFNNGKPAGKGNKSFGQKKWQGKPGGHAAQGESQSKPRQFGEQRDPGARHEHGAKQEHSAKRDSGIKRDFNAPRDFNGQGRKPHRADHDAQPLSNENAKPRFKQEQGAGGVGSRKLTGFGGSYSDGGRGDSYGNRPGHRGNGGGYARDGQRRSSGTRSGPRAGGRRDY
jgi:superfamily II DNA/RNA helicase